MVFVMKRTNIMVLVSTFLFVAVGLIYSPNTMRTIFAEPPDPCFGDGCEGTWCSDLADDAALQCCWTGPNGYQICQICWKLDDGSFAGCDPPRTKGIPDSSIIAPPPSGVAPPPSTDKCPDNSAVDSKGNCTPITQSPNDGDNKPKFPRGDILGELQTNQGTRSPS